MLMKTGILYFTACFHGFGILRHVDPFVRMLHIFKLNDPSDNTFKFDLVTERDVAYSIHNLKNKKSYGHDYLSNILLKRAQATLVKPLTFLIKQTLTTGIFLRELKISRVKPLFKKGDPMLFSN